MDNTNYGIYEVIDKKRGLELTKESVQKYLVELGYKSEEDLMMSTKPIDLGHTLLRVVNVERYRRVYQQTQPILTSSYNSTIINLISFFRSVTGVVPFISKKDFNKGININEIISKLVEEGYIVKSIEEFKVF